MVRRVSGLVLSASNAASTDGNRLSISPAQYQPATPFLITHRAHHVVMLLSGHPQSVHRHVFPNEGRPTLFFGAIFTSDN